MPKRDRELPEILALEEVNDRFFGEWVLLKVTQLDSEGEVSHGQVLHHSKSGAGLVRSAKKADEEDSHCHLYLFIGGTRKVSADELREALERAAREEYVNARW